MKFDKNDNVNALIEDGFLNLSEKKWKTSKDIFNQVIEKAPQNPYGYIGRLLEISRMTNIESLGESKKILSTSNFFKKAIQYAEDDLRKTLEDCEAQVNTKLDNIYKGALDKYNSGEYEECYKLLNDIEAYKDVANLRLNCYNKIAEKTNKSNSSSTLIKTNNAMFSNVFKAVLAGLALALIIVIVCVLAAEMDIAILIFLGTFIGFPFVILLVSSISNIKKDSDDKKLNDYFTHQGKDEIQKLESFMKINNISVPQKSTDKLKYMTEMLNVTLKHYQSIFKSNLKKQGYSNSFNISKFGTFYYNSQYTLIYHDVFFCGLKPSTKNGFTYTHNDEQSNIKYWSLSEVIEFYKRLESPSACETLAQKISLKELFWYVERPSSAGYKLADTASGAIVGGLFLGPSGALAGGMSSSKKTKKEEKEETKVFLGKKSVVRWQVAKGDIDAERAIKTLNIYFPNHRLSDTYQKHM